MRINNFINPFLKELNIQAVGKWLLYSIITGVVGGGGAVIFSYLLGNSTRFFTGYLGSHVFPYPAGEILEGMPAVSQPNWWLFAIPALGGLIAGIIV
jgi:H+/Cl- antiporter ClcA